jgi:hypothetical protein
MMVRDHIRRDGLFVDRRETDINTRMPREEASEIFGVIKSIGKRSHWTVAEFRSDVTCPSSCSGSEVIYRDYG